MSTGFFWLANIEMILPIEREPGAAGIEADEMRREQNHGPAADGRQVLVAADPHQVADPIGRLIPEHEAIEETADEVAEMRLQRSAAARLR